MRDDDADEAGRGAREVLHDLVDLSFVDLALPHRERSRGVDADHDDLVVPEHRREIGRDGARISRQRRDETREQVVERHIVIAGHDQPRKRQRVQERPRGGEFAIASPVA